MFEDQFCSAVIKACKDYYTHLKQSQDNSIKDPAGKSIVTVQSFFRMPNSHNVFRCRLSSRLKNIDFCEVFVDHIRTKHIEIIKYSGKKGEYLADIRVNNSADAFAQLTPNRITFESDLKFLLERLQRFYTEKPLFFSPPPPIEINPHSYPVSICPSPEQQKAIDKALSKPVSYIWGPPGTGKTQVVLSECILRYISAGKRIFLLAPTNNAIEQMLRSVLPVLQEVGIDLHCVYRLGTATADFAKEFPQVVGDSELEAEYVSTIKYKSSLVAELEKTLSHKAATESCCTLLHLIQRQQETLDAFYAMEEEINPLWLKRKEYDKQKKECQAVLEECRAKCAALESERLQNVKTIDSLQRSADRMKMFFWKRQKRASLLSKIADLILLSNEQRKQVSEYDIEIKKAEQEILTNQEKICSIEAEINSRSLQRTEILLRELGQTDYPEPFARFLMSLTQIDKATATDELNRTRTFYTKKSQELASAPYRSVEVIKAELEEVEASLCKDFDNEKMNQRKNALVLAATVHSSLNWLPPLEGDPVSHVFLDEAGYTSLAYGGVAFACQCPVTFLGDHMQLPPICEMKKIPVDRQEVSLFSLPCAYFSELLEAHDIKDLYQIYQKMNFLRNPVYVPPVFCEMPMAFLSKSYRFGDALAEFLSQHIYKPYDFSGNNGSALEIIILDSQTSSKKYSGKSNPIEANGIAEYLSLHPFDPESGTTWIMTPYRDQEKLLKNKLPQYVNCISTVHKAQGLEFDTAIFSVVDRADAFFVNSSIPLGKSILNTAISRTRHRLVIACDVSYWRNQPGQLLCDLIRIGEVYSFPLHLLK